MKIDSATTDCAIIVVTYNSAGDIGGMLDTLPAAAGDLRLRVLVVDNDSADDIAGALAGHPDVTLIRAGGNLGYAGGINVGRRHTGPTRSVLILNPDTRLAPDSIARMVAALDEPGVGAAVPRMESEHGLFPSQRHEPGVLRALGDALLGFRWRRRPGWFSEFVFRPDAYTAPADVDWATGAVVLVDAAADAQVGPWAEDYFLYCEEVDYCRRLREAGHRIRYVPDAVVMHRGGGSGSGPPLTALGAVSRVRYFRRYHGRLPALAYRGVIALNHLLRSWRPAERYALRIVLSERRWAELPGGTR